VPDRPFQPSLLFVGKARSLPRGGPPESGFARVGTGVRTILLLTAVKP